MIIDGQFEVVSKFGPSGDQPLAIKGLKDGLLDGLTHQTLLGVTGSGKTFSVANVIQEVQRPARWLQIKHLLPSFMVNFGSSFRIVLSSTCKLLRLLPAGSLCPHRTPI